MYLRDWRPSLVAPFICRYLTRCIGYEVACNTLGFVEPSFCSCEERRILNIAYDPPIPQKLEQVEVWTTELYTSRLNRMRSPHVCKHSIPSFIALGVRGLPWTIWTLGLSWRRVAPEMTHDMDPPSLDIMKSDRGVEEMKNSSIICCSCIHGRSR